MFYAFYYFVSLNIYFILLHFFSPLIPPLSPMDRYFVRSETRHSNGVITTVVDLGLGTAVNGNAVGSPAISNEVIDLDNVDNNQTTNLGNPQIVHCASATSQ